MAITKVKGSGTKEKPWQLTTPSGSSEYHMYRDETATPPALVCVVGKTASEWMRFLFSAERAGFEYHLLNGLP